MYYYIGYNCSSKCSLVKTDNYLSPTAVYVFIFQNSEDKLEGVMLPGEYQLHHFYDLDMLYFQQLGFTTFWG